MCEFPNELGKNILENLINSESSHHSESDTVTPNDDTCLSDELSSINDNEPEPTKIKCTSIELSQNDSMQQHQKLHTENINPLQQQLTPLQQQSNPLQQQSNQLQQQSTPLQQQLISPQQSSINKMIPIQQNILPQQMSCLQNITHNTRAIPNSQQLSVQQQLLRKSAPTMDMKKK